MKINNIAELRIKSYILNNPNDNSNPQKKLRVIVARREHIGFSDYWKDQNKKSLAVMIKSGKLKFPNDQEIEEEYEKENERQKRDFEVNRLKANKINTGIKTFKPSKLKIPKKILPNKDNNKDKDNTNKETKKEILPQKEDLMKTASLISEKMEINNINLYIKEEGKDMYLKNLDELVKMLGKK